MRRRKDRRPAPSARQADGGVARLLAVMARLRDPKAGCPWDVEQSFATIAPYTIEEAYEVAEAIRNADMAALKDELGDLLFQVVFHAQMASESGAFDFADVVDGLVDKMVRRHPHVFADAVVRDSAEQTEAWETHKAAERAAQARKKGGAVSALDGVALGLPALSRASKLQARAAKVGFDWPDVPSLLPKLDEELAELKAAADPARPKSELIGELGDVLFVLANLARHLKIDPEAALRESNAKFERRFRQIEAALAAQGKSPDGLTLAELDALWDAVKAVEPGRAQG